MIKLHELKPKVKNKKRVRVGRGIAAGGGKTAGRGTKGQKARRQIPARFEGGQMPLILRLPKRRGFKSLSKTKYMVINVEDLNIFKENSVIDRETLEKAGLIKKKEKLIKILGKGDLKVKNLEVIANAFSKTAEEKIKKMGGKVFYI